MTDNIREKAEALIKVIEASSNGTAAVTIRQWMEFDDLKAALKPSKEGVADYLEEANKHITSFNYGVRDAEKCHDFIDYVNHAIEYLRAT